MVSCSLVFCTNGHLDIDTYCVSVAKGIKSLFPVQTVSFDAIYDGFDVIVQASK